LGSGLIWCLDLTINDVCDILSFALVVLPEKFRVHWSQGIYFFLGTISLTS
jgi:hypothetical protein